MMVPFERSLSKLSKNHKIGEIGSTEFKLWRLKESLSHYYLCQLLLFKLYTSNEYVLCYCTGCWSFLRLMDLTPQDASTTMLGPLPSRSVRPLYYIIQYLSYPPQAEASPGYGAECTPPLSAEALGCRCFPTKVHCLGYI